MSLPHFALLPAIALYDNGFSIVFHIVSPKSTVKEIKSKPNLEISDLFIWNSCIEIFVWSFLYCVRSNRSSSHLDDSCFEIRTGFVWLWIFFVVKVNRRCALIDCTDRSYAYAIRNQKSNENVEREQNEINGIALVFVLRSMVYKHIVVRKVETLNHIIKFRFRPNASDSDFHLIYAKIIHVIIILGASKIWI